MGVVSVVNSGCGLNDWGGKMYMYIFTQPYHHTVVGGVRAFSFICITVTSLKSMKTAILNWFQNDGTRGFSVDQLTFACRPENPLIPSSLKSSKIAVFTSHISMHFCCAVLDKLYCNLYVTCRLRES